MGKESKGGPEAAGRVAACAGMAAATPGAQPMTQHQQEHQPQASAAAAPARSHRPVQREASSLSIVFSASWIRLTTPIGEGAFSRVYEGVYRNPDTGDESVVAVKILKKSMLKRRSDCLRFIKEAKIMTRINHRHIAACYGIGKYEDDDPHHAGSLFIVQELIRGGNLLHKVYKQMLNRAKCIYTSQEALQWMMDVASGMAYLHSVQDGKAMIIHRDLKLENIMLAPTSQGTVAKLVDFGLHKVIDDRIKKVVKRVISEANLGTRLGRLRAQHEDASLDFNLDDELEAALAEQHAMVVASSVKPGVGPAALSPLGAGSSLNGAAASLGASGAGGGPRASSLGSSLGGSAGGAALLSASGGVGALSSLGAGGGGGVLGPPPAQLRAPGRRASQLSIESSGRSMSAMPEEVDEEEQAIREAQEQQRQQQQLQAQQQQQGQGQGPRQGVACKSPLSGSTGPGGAGTGAEQGPPQQQGATQGPGLSPPGSWGGGGGGAAGANAVGGAAPVPVGVNPVVAKIRAPVKKQSSMQKLITKMKEIRLKVTGKDSALNPSTTSSQGAAATAAGGVAPDAASPTPLSRAASNASGSAALHGTAAAAAAVAGSASGGGGGPSTPPPPAPPHADASTPLTSQLLTASPSSAQQQQQQQALTPAQEFAAVAAAAAEEKRQRNMALLDRMVAAQSVAVQGEDGQGGAGGGSSLADAHGLVESEALLARAQPKQRAPPRRAVTMMNEIRYNLTEAVGSWAYMAPEVVLGQPYNEKVDVFSFGVILFEVLFRKLMLVDEIKNDPRKDAQAYAERVARGFRPEIPKHWPELLHELIAACWAQDPHQRPNFAAVVDALHELNRENCVGKLDLRLWGAANSNVFI